MSHAGPDAVLGLHGFESGVLSLADAQGLLLGAEDLLEGVLAGARIAVAALLAGVARSAVDHATRYAGERVQFGGLIKNLTAIQERLVRSDARTEALRGLVHGAACLRDAGRPHSHAARRARHVAAETARAVAHDGLQVFGGYGMSREYPAERPYRDALFPGFGEYVPHELFADSAASLE